MINVQWIFVNNENCCFLFCFAIDTLMVCISLHVELWFEIQFYGFSTNWLIHCQKSNVSPPSTGWFYRSWKTTLSWGYHRDPPKPILITRTILRRILWSLHVITCNLFPTTVIKGYISNHSVFVNVHSRYHVCWIKFCFSIL